MTKGETDMAVLRHINTLAAYVNKGNHSRSEHRELTGAIQELRFLCFREDAPHAPHKTVSVAPDDLLRLRNRALTAEVERLQSQADASAADIQQLEYRNESLRESRDILLQEALDRGAFVAEVADLLGCPKLKGPALTLYEQVNEPHKQEIRNKITNLSRAYDSACTSIEGFRETAAHRTAELEERTAQRDALSQRLEEAVLFLTDIAMRLNAPAGRLTPIKDTYEAICDQLSAFLANRAPCNDAAYIKDLHRQIVALRNQVDDPNATRASAAAERDQLLAERAVQQRIWTDDDIHAGLRVRFNCGRYGPVTARLVDNSDSFTRHLVLDERPLMVGGAMYRVSDTVKLFNELKAERV